MDDTPRITLAQIESLITAEQYHQFPGTTVTVCCLTLRNGFNAVGESACVSPAGFDGDKGKRYARENARAEVWALEGHLLRQMLHVASLAGK